MSMEKVVLKIRAAVLIANPYNKINSIDRVGLADVLLLLQKKEDGRYYSVKDEGVNLATCDYNDKKVFWDLRNDNIDDQSDEVKMYIIKNSAFIV